MKKTFKNIANIQKHVAASVNELLENNGYVPVTKERFGDGQALLLQWVNKDLPHAFQLTWDNRDRWFSLGEFNRANNLNYLESTEIDVFPYAATGVLFRSHYNVKYVEKIKSKIQEKRTTQNLT